ncbi:uncharacterized protein LOC106672491 [Cimex lectularius]|uniref:Uncharacterized protein n=1 Tax=Cimex lectularius TaxID=79782 RepID=A0A8I6S9T8_CIMLE|nr:uncharacterized protein LOC106672491 [Cimex lectularius]
MSGVETYLIEVIVSNVQVITKQYDKKPRFVGVSDGGGKDSLEMSPPPKYDQSEVDLNEPIDPNTGDVVLRLKAFKLPPIDVVEDRSKETDLERRERKEESRRLGIQESQLDRNESNASILTIAENFFPNNPTIRKKFKKGKSFLFNMNHQNLISHMQEKNSLVVHMYRDNVDRTCVGVGNLQVPRSFFAAVCNAHQSSVLRNYIDCYGPIFVDSNLHKKTMKRRRMLFRCPYPMEEDNPYSPDKLSKMEPYVRYSDIYKIPPMPKPCSFCDGNTGCGYNPNPTPTSYRTANKEAKPRFLSSGLDPEELMDPSPGMINPEKLPTTAQLEERITFLTDDDKEKACATVFIRLTCFGTALNMPYNKHECDSIAMPIPYEDE